MKKYFFLIVVLASLPTANLFAQDSAKVANQYLGVQANQLVRQILNFGGSSAPISNPYLLNYSINGATSGYGASLGLGYSLRNIKDGDENNPRESNIKSLDLRIGLDKKWRFSKFVIAGWGLDVLKSNFKNHTSNKNIFDDGAQFFEVVTESKDKGWGFGPRFTLMFSITKGLIVGTEMTYYYRYIKTVGEVTNSSQFQQFDEFGNFQTIRQSEKIKNRASDQSIQLNLPSIIYLHFTF